MLSEILFLFLGNTFVVGLAGYWLKTRLEHSIRFEYEQRMEVFREEIRRRERAGMVAELFAEWMADPEDRTHLNRLTWEASLWLPPEIVAEMSKRLNNAPGAPDLKEVLVAVRRHLWGQEDPIEPMHLIHFPPSGSKSPGLIASEPASVILEQSDST